MVAPAAMTPAAVALATEAGGGGPGDGGWRRPWRRRLATAVAVMAALRESVVAGLDQPLTVLHHGQPGAPVLGDQLEPGLPA